MGIPETLVYSCKPKLQAVGIEIQLLELLRERIETIYPIEPITEYFPFTCFVGLPKNRSVECIINIVQQVIVIFVPELELFIIG